MTALHPGLGPALARWWTDAQAGRTSGAGTARRSARPAPRGDRPRPRRTTWPGWSACSGPSRPIRSGWRSGAAPACAASSPRLRAHARRRAAPRRSTSAARRRRDPGHPHRDRQRRAPDRDDGPPRDRRAARLAPGRRAGSSPSGCCSPRSGRRGCASRSWRPPTRGTRPPSTGCWPLVLDHKLLRFAAAVRAAGVWLGFAPRSSTSRWSSAGAHARRVPGRSRPRRPGARRPATRGTSTSRCAPGHARRAWPPLPEAGRWPGTPTRMRAAAVRYAAATGLTAGQELTRRGRRRPRPPGRRAGGLAAEPTSGWQRPAPSTPWPGWSRGCRPGPTADRPRRRAGPGARCPGRGRSASWCAPGDRPVADLLPWLPVMDAGGRASVARAGSRTERVLHREPAPGGHRPAQRPQLARARHRDRGAHQDPPRPGRGAGHRGAADPRRDRPPARRADPARLAAAGRRPRVRRPAGREQGQAPARRRRAELLRRQGAGARRRRQAAAGRPGPAACAHRLARTRTAASPAAPQRRRVRRRADGRRGSSRARRGRRPRTGTCRSRSRPGRAARRCCSATSGSFPAPFARRSPAPDGAGAASGRRDGPRRGVPRLVADPAGGCAAEGRRPRRAARLRQLPPSWSAGRSAPRPGGLCARASQGRLVELASACDGGSSPATRRPAAAPSRRRPARRPPGSWSSTPAAGRRRVPGRARGDPGRGAAGACSPRPAHRSGQPGRSSCGSWSTGAWRSRAATGATACRAPVARAAHRPARAAPELFTTAQVEPLVPADALGGAAGPGRDAAAGRRPAARAAHAPACRLRRRRRAVVPVPAQRAFRDLTRHWRGQQEARYPRLIPVADRVRDRVVAVEPAR